ncbi:IclR family transcriptional regulator [Novosphingobium sp. BL-52-GroH]|uniref:IclR family transcriptional regulator n=1 Tax=Novosphingobium sp. BL-52-GroH TaxID=3349877 RepID=UPI00384F46F5
MVNAKWAGSAALELKTPVRPVANAIGILRHLSDGKSSTSTQIARDLKINASTCFNILRTLVAENILSFDQAGKTYKRGAGLLGLTAGMMSQEGRILAARERLAEFAREQNATVALWERVSLDRNVLVATEHGSGNVRIYLQVQDRFPVLLGSTGRLLATRLGLSKAEIRRRYAETRWFNKPEFESYWDDAVKAADTGHAVDDGDFSAGVLTVSVPVEDGAGNIGYSLTALTFRELCRGRAVARMTKKLTVLSEEVAKFLY